MLIITEPKLFCPSRQSRPPPLWLPRAGVFFTCLVPAQFINTHWRQIVLVTRLVVLLCCCKCSLLIHFNVGHTTGRHPYSWASFLLTPTDLTQSQPSSRLSYHEAFLVFFFPTWREHG